MTFKNARDTTAAIMYIIYIMSRPYTIAFTAEAAKAFNKLDSPIRDRIAKKIDALAADPRPSGVTQLVAQKEPVYRLRVGDYRVIYKISDERLIVLIGRVGNRRDVYKKEL